MNTGVEWARSRIPAGVDDEPLCTTTTHVGELLCSRPARRREIDGLGEEGQER